MNLEGEQMESGSKERMMVVVGEVMLKGGEMLDLCIELFFMPQR
jgi:hypothetical protein